MKLSLFCDGYVSAIDPNQESSLSRGMLYSSEASDKVALTLKGT